MDSSPERLLMEREGERPRPRQHAAPHEFQQLFHPSDRDARVHSTNGRISHG